MLYYNEVVYWLRLPTMQWENHSKQSEISKEKRMLYSVCNINKAYDALTQMCQEKARSSLHSLWQLSSVHKSHMNEFYRQSSMCEPNKQQMVKQ